MLVTTTYQRKTFRVQAIQLTKDNLAEVSRWCDGEVRIETSGPGGGLGEAYVIVKIGQINGRPQHANAYAGDWVTRLSVENNFRVYKDKSFKEAFEEMNRDMKKYAEVHSVIVNAMRKQDAATYNGESSRRMDEVADKATRNILELF